MATEAQDDAAVLRAAIAVLRRYGWGGAAMLTALADELDPPAQTTEDNTRQET